MTLTYDAVADTLYLTFEDPAKGPQFYHIEARTGDVYRIDESRRVIVGCTILQFIKRIGHEDIVLPEIGPVGYDPAQKGTE